MGGSAYWDKDYPEFRYWDGSRLRVSTYNEDNHDLDWEIAIPWNIAKIIRVVADNGGGSFTKEICQFSIDNGWCDLHLNEPDGPYESHGVVHAKFPVRGIGYVLDGILQDRFRYDGGDELLWDLFQRLSGRKDLREGLKETE
jgi:hypothetical protein